VCETEKENTSCVLEIESRPSSFFQTGFRPLCPSFVKFVPLPRTKPAFWISTRKPILIEPGSILVHGFDTRLISRGFSCGPCVTEIECVCVRQGVCVWGRERERSVRA